MSTAEEIEGWIATGADGKVHFVNRGSAYALVPGRRVGEPDPPGYSVKGAPRPAPSGIRFQVFDDAVNAGWYATKPIRLFRVAGDVIQLGDPFSLCVQLRVLFEGEPYLFYGPNGGDVLALLDWIGALNQEQMIRLGQIYALVSRGGAVANAALERAKRSPLYMAAKVAKAKAEWSIRTRRQALGLSSIGWMRAAHEAAGYLAMDAAFGSALDTAPATSGAAQTEMLAVLRASVTSALGLPTAFRSHPAHEVLSTADVVDALRP